MPAEIDSSKPTLYFQYAGLTNTGMIRDHNEDAYKVPEETTTESHKGHLYVLADGMGGHRKGEVASAVTIEAVNKEYYATITSLEDNDEPEEAVIEALSQAINQANLEVMDATEGGGTTVVAAVLHGDSLVVMNVGDSRAYLLREDELQFISRDHSLVSRLVEMGKITEEEASNHPRRNVLYQALGQETEVEIYTYSAKLEPDDVIILCSDGLWGEVDEQIIKDILTYAPSPLIATKRLIDMANASGGPDNITAIVIQVSDQPPEEDSSPRKADETKPTKPIKPPQ